MKSRIDNTKRSKKAGQPEQSDSVQLTLDFAPVAVRRFGALMLIIVVTVALMMSIPVIKNAWQHLTNRYPLKRIEVFGTFNHLNAQKLRDTLEKFLEYNYFDVKLENIKITAEQLAWVETAAIRKAWPDTIVVQIQERVAVANWGKSHLISHRHTIFHSHETPSIPGLPTFVGPKEHAERIMEHYRQVSRLLKPAALAIETVTLEDRMSWNIQLKGGMVIVVDDEDAIERIQRFVVVYQQMPEQQRHSIERVDLRYENGLAIKWKNKHGDSDAA